MEIMINLPPAVYERVVRTAYGLSQPVPEALAKIVEGGLPSLAKVPAKYRLELEQLETMPNESLWQVAQSTMPLTRQDHIETLLQQNQAQTLTPSEQQELQQLRAESQRLMFRKSYAYLLLKWRGQRIPAL